MDDIMKVRGHHILCIQGFQGYGYSEKFVEHMSKAIKDLSTSSQIKILDECDEICSMCTNNCNNRCKDAAKISKMDKIVLEELGIKKGEIINLKEYNIFEYANKKLQNKEKSQRICGECSWQRVCLWFIKAKEN